MPSTFVAFRSTSAPISLARSAAAESVEKYGLPVPPANTTTRPFSKWRIALRWMNGSASFGISMDVITRVGTPIASSAFIIARPLIIVASMPIESPVTRFTPCAEPASPRKMLPPPRTMPTWHPSAWIFFTRSAMNASFAGSMHSPVSRLASTSPESFRRMRLYLSFFFTATIFPFFSARRNSEF